MKKITNNADKAIIISYLNDSFDLIETEDCFNDKDKILEVWRRDNGLHRSFLVYFLYDKKPLVGIFHEWKDNATEDRYKYNRYVLMSKDVVDTIKSLDMTMIKVLYDKAKA